MREENAIEVRDITKSFKVYMDRSNNVKDFLIHKNRRRNEVRDVLKGISFDVKKGEAVGLIGRNGCGKSTTLKLLTRIMYPDSGSIEMRGRVTSLIELGAGFHPDMSGRENIYINASIFGLSRSEIDARVQDIIDFSELADYIDNPVRTYSSGMYMRLAFAVAINVDADILLIDEILAVGDIAFQSKCYRKLKEIRKQGVTIVLVSHALGQVESICDTTIWIEKGVIRMKGRPKDVHAYYLTEMGSAEDIPADESSEALKRRVRMQGDYIERLRGDLYAALSNMDLKNAPSSLDDAITQFHMDGTSISEEEVKEAFKKLSPDKEKKYLYYGCVGHTDMIGKFRMEGYKVYGYESYALNVETPYVMCGPEMIRDMRFDDVFEAGYLENSADPDIVKKHMESLKKNEDKPTKIDMLPRMRMRCDIPDENATKIDRMNEDNMIPEHGILYGPYCTLFDGNFKLHYKMEKKDGSNKYYIRITSGFGDDTIVERITDSNEGYIDFATDRIYEGVEFLVKSEDDSAFKISELSVEL